MIEVGTVSELSGLGKDMFGRQNDHCPSQAGTGPKSMGAATAEFVH